MTMTCEEVQDHLDELNDGALAPLDAEAVRRHLAGCPSCSEDAAALAEVLSLAGSLPAEMAPSRDLWPGIAQRLETARRPGLVVQPGWLAAAAAALVVLTSAATWLATRATSPTAAVSPAPVPLPTTEAPAPSQVVNEALYAAATDELMQAFESRRDRLSPETRVVVERNLAVIDEALAEIRAALRSDPANAALARRLGSVHRRKIEVLRSVVSLSS